MEDYSVLIEARSDGKERIADPSSLTGVLTQAFQPFRGVCKVGEDRWDAMVTVAAGDAAEAGAVAAALVRSLAGKAGLPPWPIVHLDVMRGDILDEELPRPPSRDRPQPRGRDARRG